MTTSYIVTGANRGIGFELVKKLSENVDNVIVATSRSLERAEALRNLNKQNIEIIQLDVTDSVDELKAALAKLKFLAKYGVDVFIQNAGIGFLPKVPDYTIDQPIESYTKFFEGNTLSSVKFYQAIYPYWLKEHAGVTKKGVYVSSVAGTIGDLAFTTFAYGLSKAALNFHAKHTSFEHSNSENPTLKSSITVAIHPGLVLTDMGTPGAKAYNLESIAITPEQSGESVVKLIEGLKSEDNGEFLNYDGTKLNY